MQSTIATGQGVRWRLSMAVPATTPKTIVRAPALRLDRIAAGILKERDEERWRLFCAKYPSLASIEPSHTAPFDAALSRLYRKAQAPIDKATEQFKSLWHGIGQHWYDFMEEFFGIRSSSLGPVRCSIGLGIIFPRDLASQEFLLPYYAPPSVQLVIAAHEISHFYFYAAESELAKDSSSVDAKTIWRLSEALVPLLFATQRARELLPDVPQTGSYAASDAELAACKEAFMGRYTGTADWHSTREQLLRILMGRDLPRDYDFR